MWIDKQLKKAYSDSSIKGLRVKYSRLVSQELAAKIKDFIKFLRNKYYFPIRCTIWIKPGKGFFENEQSSKLSIGNFYYYDDELKKTPFIWIATGRYHIVQDEKKKMKLIIFYLQLRMN